MRNLWILCMLCSICCEIWAVQPQVSSLSVSHHLETKLVEISYNLDDIDSALLDVVVWVYTNDSFGLFHEINSSSMAGCLGPFQACGNKKTVLWDAMQDIPDINSSQIWIRVYAFDYTTWKVPTNEMVLIPEGWFNMGDNYGLEPDAMPVHPVYVSPFFIGKYEVTNEELQHVFQWAYDHNKIYVNYSNPYWTEVENTEGVSFSLISYSTQAPKPYEFFFSNGKFYVHEGRELFPCNIGWRAAVAYCNFKSDMEGIERCYDFSLGSYDISSPNWQSWACDFSKNGYRLPTEAEWEKAARGTLDGHHFPWPSYGSNWFEHIDQSKANYHSWPDGTRPVGYYNGSQFPPGCDIVNRYGLYDIAGNVSEWCWDWYISTYYSLSPITDPIGPLLGDVQNIPSRIIRGGSFETIIDYLNPQRFELRCASRAYEFVTQSVWRYFKKQTEFQNYAIGFRIARRDPNANITMGYRTLRSEASSIYGPITIDTTGPNTPGIVQFNTTTTTADANAETVALTVMRLGGTLGTTSIDYTTSDGTALAGTDYIATTGTLHWADGDNTNQSITINILPDASSGSDKTFSVLLSNPTGASLGEDYTNAVVTIKSAESRTPVYRLYSYGQSDSTYEHVWTTDWNEMAIMSTALGWLYEGVAWHAFTEYVQGTTPLYRLYSPSTRMHHYTIDATEYYILTEQSGGAWNGEGIQYFVYADDAVPGTMPVYRFYHAGMGLHHFTIDADEAAVIQATPEWGYVYEDIGFYVYSE